MNDDTDQRDDELEIESLDDLDKETNPDGPGPIIPEPPAATASYFEKIVKHIPASLIAAHTASLGLLAEAAPAPEWLHWAVFLSIWILVPFYTLYIPGQIPDKSVSKRYCVLASTISFAVWSYAINGSVIAVSFPEYYQPLYGSLLLIITTLILPVLEIVLKKFNYFRPEEES